ncbi:ComEA family DNA-binding protein [Colidextribacter sp. OB.20]|uniref:ComEA family DNA-binding protein n=1 Tax=Colidextribacter sp. OB.20 TaxID=2304568 RepID=UPI00136CA5F5|nr:ComEA family DNA-binding protein [Colidextribacter sp. OB.20]NBI09171.1 ComEA family DNA-binding protein [Colidextribacter sp. OB.20]
MAEMSKYGKAVLALTAGFVLFCGGWFSSRLSAAQPYQVTAQRRPVLEEEAPVQEEGAYPDSLLPGEVINVNTADAYDLRRLPGVGEKRAQDIVAWREEHGPFETVDGLTEVSGIGPGILEGLREYVTVK